MELKDIMTTNVAFVNRNTSIEEAARLMKEYNVGSIPVCDRGVVVGMITDRDIVLRGMASGNTNPSSSCGDLMSTNPVTANPDMDVHEAARLMAQKQIRRLPVVQNGRLEGIVSLGDLAVESIYVNEAGDALNNISKPSRPMS